MNVNNDQSPSKQTEFQCNFCFEYFGTQSDLNGHNRMHTGQNPYNCTECDKTFSYKSALETHKRVHSGERPYHCDECAKAFKRKHGLNRHKRIHSGVTPYHCNECGKTFKQKCNLDSHKRIHSGVKPYHCNECGKAFKQSNHLDTHKRIHSGVKPYSCNACSQSFRHKISLNRHTRSKICNKTYSCVECGANFSRKCDLLKHFRPRYLNETNQHKNRNHVDPINPSEIQSSTGSTNISFYPNTQIGAHQNVSSPVNSNEIDLTTNSMHDLNFNQSQANIQGLQSFVETRNTNGVRSVNSYISNGNNIPNISGPFNLNTNQSPSINLNQTMNTNEQREIIRQPQYTNQIPPINQTHVRSNAGSTSILLHGNPQSSITPNLLPYTNTFHNRNHQPEINFPPLPSHSPRTNNILPNYSIPFTLNRNVFPNNNLNANNLTNMNVLHENTIHPNRSTNHQISPINPTNIHSTPSSTGTFSNANVQNSINQNLPPFLNTNEMNLHANFRNYVNEFQRNYQLRHWNATRTNPIHPQYASVTDYNINQPYISYPLPLYGHLFQPPIHLDNIIISHPAPPPPRPQINITLTNNTISTSSTAAASPGMEEKQSFRPYIRQNEPRN